MNKSLSFVTVATKGGAVRTTIRAERWMQAYARKDGGLTVRVDSKTVRFGKTDAPKIVRKG